MIDIEKLSGGIVGIKQNKIIISLKTSIICMLCTVLLIFNSFSVSFFNTKVIIRLKELKKLLLLFESRY